MEDPRLGSDDKVGVGTAPERTGVQMLKRRVTRKDLATTMMIEMEVRRKLPNEFIYIYPFHVQNS